MIEIQKEIDKEWKEIFKNSKHKWKIPIYENSIKKINRRINPMKAQEKIVLFKRFKSELINKAMVEEGITYPDNIAPYYLPIDDNPFITMDDKKAQEVWNELVENIEEEESNNLGSYTCPECIAFYNESNSSECQSCPYQKHHGKCCINDNNNNTWSFLIKKLGFFISDNNYKEILKEIENLEIINDMQNQSETKVINEKPVCKITCEAFAWVLEVDGHTFDFVGELFAEYLKDHYEKIGYNVIWDRDKWKREAGKVI